MLKRPLTIIRVIVDAIIYQYLGQYSVPTQLNQPAPESGWQEEAHFSIRFAKCYAILHWAAGSIIRKGMLDYPSEAVLKAVLKAVLRLYQTVITRYYLR